MQTNLVQVLKTSINNSSNLKKSIKISSDSRFDEVLNNNIAVKQKNTEVSSKKSTDRVETKTENKTDLEEKNDKPSNTKKAETNEDMQAILNLFLNLTGSAENIQNIEFDNEKIQKLLAAVKSGDNSSLLSELLQNADSKLGKLIEDMLSLDKEQSLDSSIFSNLKAILSSKDTHKINDELKAIRQMLKGNGENSEINLRDIIDSSNTAEVTAKDTKSDGYSGSADSSMKSSKEDSILKSILGEKEDNSSRAVSMISQLNRFKQDINTSTEQVNVPVVNRSTFNADIIKAVKYMDVNNLKELTVNINPKELGALTIRVTMEAGIMRANISASNKETQSLLNSNLAELKNSLINTDLKVQEVSINIYNDDTTYFSGNFRDGNGSFNQNNQGYRQERIEKIQEANDIVKEQTAAERDNNLSILA